MIRSVHRSTAFLAMALVCALASTAATCGNQTPEVVVTRTAEYGLKITQIGRVAQDTLVKAHEAKAPGLTDDRVAKAMVQFRTLGETLEKLSNALEAYDALGTNAAARVTSIADIENLMRQARGITRAVLVFVPNEEVATQLNTLFSNLEDLFFEINTGLAKFKVTAKPVSTLVLVDLKEAA